MRHAVVPAQITTLEDRLTANLTVTQAALIIGAIIADGFIFAFVDPVFKVAVPKTVVAAFATVFFLSLALRVKEKLVLHWTGLMMNYLLRPRIYILGKQSAAGDNLFNLGKVAKPETLVPPLPVRDLQYLSGKVDVSFKFTRNGRISVLQQSKT